MPSPHNYRITSFSTLIGFLYGLRQHAVVIDAHVDSACGDHGLVAHVHGLLRPMLPDCPPADLESLTLSDIGGEANLQLLCALLAALEERSGGVVSGPAIVVPRLDDTAPEGWHAVRILAPSTLPKSALPLARHLAGRVRAYVDAGQPDGFFADEKAELDAVGKRHSNDFAFGTSSRHFLREALNMDIPVLRLPLGMVQYGYGKGARLFRSTTSDTTSSMGMLLSTDKAAASQMLRLAGFPVADQAKVASENEAIAAAEAFGFPVVVKPTDRTHGDGVFPRLVSTEEVAQRFHDACAQSPNVVVERHIEGQDYRVNVVAGKVVGAVLRLPAGVTGDGEHTIRALIAQENKDPRRSAGAFSVMKPIEIDDDLRAYLHKTGYKLTSVPEEGVFVRLRANANVSSGGSTVVVTDDIHPENVRLCERACALMALDIAGVDLICRSIAEPVAATGGTICEINVMPQMGHTYLHSFHMALRDYVGPGQSDEGIVLRLAWEGDVIDRSALVAQVLDRRGPGQIVGDWQPGFAETGLPVDRIGTVVIGDGTAPDLQEAFRLLKPYLRGEVILTEKHADDPLLKDALEGCLMRVVPAQSDISLPDPGAQG
ncbi:MAG: hypothetical protein CSA72_02865 [Rhodobacterales bacterium]|nr:MAG: hypothetical protein CSA72_02865 [Rhodobacterales bacterium]